jgi:hypothetical protein
MANLEPEAPVSQWARGFAAGHMWLEKAWDRYLPEEITVVRHLLGFPPQKEPGMSTIRLLSAHEKTWSPVGNVFAYEGVAGTHQWYDGTPHPWEFKQVWHMEPSLTDPDTVYAGVEDAGS